MYILDWREQTYLYLQQYLQQLDFTWGNSEDPPAVEKMPEWRYYSTFVFR